MTASNLCEDVARGNGMHWETAKGMVEVLLSPRSFKLATAAFNGATAASGGDSIALQLGSLLRVAAVAFEPGASAPSCLRGESLQKVMSCIEPLSGRVASTIKAASGGMLSGNSSKRPSFDAQGGVLKMLPPAAQHLGEQAAQLALGVELLGPYLMDSSSEGPASGAGADDPTGSTVTEAEFAHNFVRKAMYPLMMLPGFQSLVAFERAAMDLAAGRAPHAMMLNMLPGFLLSKLSRVVDLTPRDGVKEIVIPGSSQVRVLMSPDTSVGSGYLEVSNSAGVTARVDGTAALPGGEMRLPSGFSHLAGGTTAFAVAPLAADDATLSLTAGNGRLSS